VALPAPNTSDPYVEWLKLTCNKGKENLYITCIENINNVFAVGV
jgi:hypothetical protein